MSAQPDLKITSLVFDALDVMRSNGAVMRKYFFLPFIILSLSQILGEVPYLGLSAQLIGTSVATALIVVSASRFTRLRDASQVGVGANRAFARVFAALFAFSVAEGIATVMLTNSVALPSLLGIGIGGLFFLVWLQIKLSFLLPALAFDEHPQSVYQTAQAAYAWSTGLWWKILGILLFCYGPVIFFFFLTSRAQLSPDTTAGNMPLAITLMIALSACQIISTLWSSISIALFYDRLKLGQPHP